MKIKVSEATGATLDWMVAKCEGYSGYDAAMGRVQAPRKEYGWVDLCNLNYSTDWAQGGPIIEREKVAVWTADGVNWHAREFVLATSPVSVGPTPLVAAMRCYCASKLGDEVEVPEELS